MKTELLDHISKPVRGLALHIVGACRDLLPIIIVIGFFQFVVLRQPFPHLIDTFVGLIFVILGLALFVLGLGMGLFPIGEALAESFAYKGSLFWLLLFGFGLGFSTTIAEPALIAVALEAAEVAANAQFISSDPSSMQSYAIGLRITVALSVGIAILFGLIRILKGWPVHYLIIGGYVIVMIMTAFAPREIVGIAYDSGGVTTSTVTVPLVAAVGVGLASAIRERNPLVDGFGLIAFASLLPMVFVMAYGMFVFGLAK
jgi:MFS family permease